MTPSIPPFLKPVFPLFHPLFMWTILALTLYALYLGIQIVRLRSAEGETKTKLIQGKFAIKHYQIGSMILALMVLGAIGGMAATYLIAGKLILGPHLIVGLSMTGLIAISASLSPWLKSGVQWARVLHVSLNLILVGLFASQAVTGIKIVKNIMNPPPATASTVESVPNPIASLMDSSQTLKP